MKIRNIAAAAALVVASLGQGAMAAPVLWVSDGDGTLGTVDVATGAATVVGQMSQVMTDIAFDSSGNLWGITFGQLFKINSTTAATTLVGNLGTSLNSLVFGADGTLYSANNSLWKINTSTGVASLIGSGGGYTSSGDLAFIGSQLFLTATGGASDRLFDLNEATGAGTFIGNLGVSSAFGLATDNNINLYGVAGQGVYSINTGTGAASFLNNYAGTSLGAAFGSAFFSEAGAPVPEPGTIALTGLALLAAFGASARRRRS